MHTELTAPVQSGLAVYYVIAALLNAGFAYYFVRQRDRGQALLWIVVAGLFLLHAVAYLTPAGRSMVIPESVTSAVDAATNAVSYFVLSTVAFIVVLVWPRFFTAPLVAIGLLDLTLLSPAGRSPTRTSGRSSPRRTTSRS